MITNPCPMCGAANPSHHAPECACADGAFCYVTCNECGVHNLIKHKPSAGWVCGTCGAHLVLEVPS